MLGYFLDTSALAKRYHPESGTPTVLSLFAEPGAACRISKLALTELHSVFAMKVRSGALRRDQVDALRARLWADVAQGDVEVFSITDAHYEAAERLILQYAFVYRLRTLDALQLAVALDLRGQGLIDVLVVADRALAEVAEFAGLQVLNPEAP